MGVADFAFSHSVSFRKKPGTGEATEIILEPTANALVAKNHSGQELYTLTRNDLDQYSMRDSEGHAVLQTRRDPHNHQQFSILDRQGQVIGHRGTSSFQWEHLLITWTSKSLALLSEPVLVARHEGADKDLGGSARPPLPQDGILAELQMASANKSGSLRVPASIVTSRAFPPLGLFLFEALILNQEYISSNALRRLSIGTMRRLSIGSPLNVS